MISMVEKIRRLGLTDCAPSLAHMERKLREGRTQFLASPELLPFEREWMERYIPG